MGGTVALSEHEQQMLKEIEQSLLSEDPKFGAVVTDGDFARSKGTVTLRGIAIVVIGLVLLVTGVALSQMSLWWLSLSILGFLVMVAGGMWMLRGGGKSTFQLSDGYHSSAGRRRPQKSGGLGDRMEDNFRRRFEN